VPALSNTIHQQQNHDDGSGLAATVRSPAQEVSATGSRRRAAAGKSRPVLLVLNLFAEVLDVFAKSFGGLAAGAGEGHESHGEKEKEELFQGGLHT
jgi:hypothetical protein